MKYFTTAASHEKNGVPVRGGRRRRCRLTVLVYSVPVCIDVLGRRRRLTVFVHSVYRCVLVCTHLSKPSFGLQSVFRRFFKMASSTRHHTPGHTSAPYVPVAMHNLALCYEQGWGRDNTQRGGALISFVFSDPLPLWNPRFLSLRLSTHTRPD